MKSIAKKICALFMMAVMVFCSLGVSSVAASSGQDKVVLTRSQKGICSYTETLIYTGKGRDRWLHISPWLTPNNFVIRMVDYQGIQVWWQYFTTVGTTHWFVGSNVKYVYLSGIPGGVVDVTDTEH